MPRLSTSGNPILTPSIIVSFLALLFATNALADVYQWSTTIDEVVSSETKGAPRAFLWVPERCQRVRAVVIAIQNMQEEQLFKNAMFRETLGDLDFALVWIAPPLGTGNFRFDQGDDKILQRVLGTLAEESGYTELRVAPLVPVGHSASASWCWDVAAWKPERILAVLSLSGQWPYFSAQFWGDRNIDQVPGLTTKGEFEIEANLEQGWYAGLKGDFYKKHPTAAFTHVVEPGDGHFAASNDKIALINLFLHKAAQYRLPATFPAVDEPIALKPIDAGTTGWRYETWHPDAAPELATAPAGEFKGKLERSFWAFDEEMARAIERFQSTQRNKTNTLIGYVQKDGLTQPRPDHFMNYLKFEPMEDGLTFKLRGGFFDTVPAATTKDGKPTGWQRMVRNYRDVAEQGAPIAHPIGQDEKLSIDVICGPVVKLSNDTFTVRFDRTGFDNPKRNSSPGFIMTYPGDATYKRMVQQAVLKFPLKNTGGAEQSITFPTIGDKKLGTASVQLAATSSANLPVYYYVREGPAEVDGDTLRLTEIPPRAKFPIKVTVVAWQWGRSIDPKLKSATPVQQTFNLLP